MKDRCRLLAFLVLSGVTAAAAQPPATQASHGTHAAQDPHATHNSHATHNTTPASAHPAHTPAQRWASDAALREGMRRVQAALAQLHHHEQGHLPAAAAQEQAAHIQAAIRFLFANCRLAPEADAALHQILLPLLQAAQRLEHDPADRSAVAALRAAVTPYPLQFDDPGWPAPAAAAQ